MLTKQDVDTLSGKINRSEAYNSKYSEQDRMKALMDVVSKVDANDPQKIMGKGGEYGLYTNVDVATLIFRFATRLQDENNFDKIMDELKKRGIPDKTFGDAFVIMQKDKNIYPYEYRKKVMKMANGQYSPELFEKLHERDLFKESDPFLSYAFYNYDMGALKKYGFDVKKITEMDTGKEKWSHKYPDNKIRIASEDGKNWIELTLEGLSFWKAKLKVKEKQSQSIQTNINSNNVETR